MRQILTTLHLTPRPNVELSDATPADVHHRGHAFRLSVAGELDIATVDALTNVAVNALLLPVRVLVLDFDGVTFCGAAGITALVKIHGVAAEAGTPFVLTGVRPPVGRVLDLVGLSTMVAFRGTYEASAEPTTSSRIYESRSRPLDLATMATPVMAWPDRVEQD
jgi:anti-sigma B factor antagonist